MAVLMAAAHRISLFFGLALFRGGWLYPAQKKNRLAAKVLAWLGTGPFQP
jgi:hypothetical protein